MKGGRTAPRNLPQERTDRQTLTRFNEGGADCPPKQEPITRQELAQISFNEGGADCPPKLLPERTDRQTLTRFNEGGADCPPKPQAAN